MRLWSLLFITASALSLTACETIGLKGKEDGDTGKTETVAAAKAVPGNEASAQEQKEIINLMGEGAGAEVSVAADDTLADEAAEDAGTTVDAIEQAAAAPSTTTTLAEDEAKMPKDVNFTPGVPDGCPGVEVLPDTKSITYFNDKDGRPVGGITARAQLVDIKGGCDYSDNSVVVDIDMIMQGHITDKGRYEGRKDLEAFMTFPYFVAVMDPQGKMIDKKIMATAMRFKPAVDDLDHAEKITQTIPLADIGAGSKYTITLGFQLNRQQLDYNRGVVSSKPATPVASKPAETKPAPKADVKSEPKAEKKAEVKPEAKKEEPKTVVEKPVVTDKPATLAPAQSQGSSSASKMKPIVD